MTEAEVTFRITDPIIKGILRCTNCVVAAEERVPRQPSTSQPSTSQYHTSPDPNASPSQASSPQHSASKPSTSEMKTPSQQKSISEGIISDYTILYLL